MLIAVCALTFVLFFLLPSGDPAVLRAGRNATPETVARIREQLHLDDPVWVQFWIYLKGVFLHFDLGYSYYSSQPVSVLLRERLPATLSLTLGAVVLWLAIAPPIGVVSALRRRGWADRLCMGGALIAISAPVYWVGLVALYLFSDDIGLIPLLPGANSYVGLTERPRRLVRRAAAAVAGAGRRLRGGVRPRAADEHDRDDEPGLRPHRAREGDLRAAGRAAPRRARARSRRS